jgi:hypothetical protein
MKCRLGVDKAVVLTVAGWMMEGGGYADGRSRPMLTIAADLGGGWSSIGR